MILATSLVGCASPSGQVGSNAAYEYKQTPEGGCEVTVYSGREQVEAISLSISPDCEVKAEASALTSGSTNEALIKVIDRLVPVP